MRTTVLTLYVAPAWRAAVMLSLMRLRLPSKSIAHWFRLHVASVANRRRMMAGLRCSWRLDVHPRVPKRLLLTMLLLLSLLLLLLGWLGESVVSTRSRCCVRKLLLRSVEITLSRSLRKHVSVTAARTVRSTCTVFKALERCNPSHKQRIQRNKVVAARALATLRGRLVTLLLQHAR
jgi:hypothetical protein